MTLKEFNDINWHRGNIAKLDNGKEYIVKGTKGHGKYLLLFSEEYEKCFVADYRIVDCRTSDYEEPEEIYLEMRRRKREEAEALREAERLERLRAKEERKQRNLQEQERIHQEALARKAAKRNNQAKQKAEVSEVSEVSKVSEASKVSKVSEASETETAPKRKRKRIIISRPKKIEF